MRQRRLTAALLEIAQSDSICFPVFGAAAIGASRVHIKRCAKEMKLIAQAAIAGFFLSFSSAHELAVELLPRKPSAIELFQMFDREEFIAEPKDPIRGEVPTISWGPMVPVNEEKLLKMSEIYFQAEMVAMDAKRGFDVAFERLDDPKLYVRWIAVESLIKITGLSPPWYRYGEPGELANGDREWSDKAKAVWKQWKAQQGD